MAAITINQDTEVVVTAAVAVEIVPARSGRTILVIQNQGVGNLWLSFGGTPAVGNGWRIGSWERISLEGAAGKGNGTDFYEGAIDAIFEGGGNDTVQGGGGIDRTIVRVLEAT